MSVKINILEQSPIREGVTHRQALENTVKVAQVAEKWGYSRFWLSEHHELSRFAGNSPEILIPIIAGQTESIRVGAGGMLSPNHSPYKVAEVFSQIVDFFPGRIDLGIGRAPGGDDEVLKKLRLGAPIPHSEFLSDLCEHLQKLQEERYLHEGEVPDLWLLGSSPEFATYTQFPQFKMCYGHFIRSNGGLKTVREIRTRFQELHKSDPYIAIAVHVICSDNTAVLKNMVRAYGVSLLYHLNGKEVLLPSLKTVESYVLSSEEKERIQNAMSTNGVVIGTGSSVAEELKVLAEAYGASELTIVTHGYDLESRMESLETLAKHFF